LAVCLTWIACGEGDQPQQGYYASKTPYEPQQHASSYEPAPPGYTAVFTQLVARHGSRALESASNTDFIKQLLASAQAPQRQWSCG